MIKGIGLSDGGVDNGGLGFFYFEAFGGEFAVDEGEEFFEQTGLGKPVAVAAEGAVVGDVHFVEAAEEVEVDAGEDAVFDEFGIGEAVPLSEQDGFEHGQQGIGGTTSVVSKVTGSLTIQVLLDRLPINHLIQLQ